LHFLNVFDGYGGKCTQYFSKNKKNRKKNLVFKEKTLFLQQKLKF